MISWDLEEPLYQLGSARHHQERADSDDEPLERGASKQLGRDEVAGGADAHGLDGTESPGLRRASSNSISLPLRPAPFSGVAAFVWSIGGRRQKAPEGVQWI